jgi:hypothetical protein
MQAIHTTDVIVENKPSWKFENEKGKEKERVRVRLFCRR